jgi:putative molybdopterin biosynthesis protein
VPEGNRGTFLRRARRARGFSQLQLAGMASVSRQAVSAVESGRADPSLRVGLALARALGLTVEEAFGGGAPAPVVSVRPVAPLGEAGSRVALAPMGETFVALPLIAAAAARDGFVPASGLTDGVAGRQPQPSGRQPRSSRTGGSQGVCSVQPVGPPRITLVVAGSDPALPLLAVPLGLLDPPVALAWWPCGTEEALGLAADGLVHVAGAHLSGQYGDYHTGPGQDLLRHGAEVIAFCSWREGLVIRPELAAAVASVADLRHTGLRIVNWEPGAEARRALDRELAGHGIDPGQLPGYETRATGHLQVAAAVAAGLADAGIASEPAALAYRLAFVPLASKQFDLLIPATAGDSQEIRGLRKALSSRWLRDQLVSLPGYDPSHCGENVTTLRL